MSFNRHQPPRDLRQAPIGGVLRPADNVTNAFRCALRNLPSNNLVNLTTYTGVSTKTPGSCGVIALLGGILGKTTGYFRPHSRRKSAGCRLLLTPHRSTGRSQNGSVSHNVAEPQQCCTIWKNMNAKNSRATLETHSSVGRRSKFEPVEAVTKISTLLYQRERENSWRFER